MTEHLCMRCRMGKNRLREASWSSKAIMGTVWRLGGEDVWFCNECAAQLTIQRFAVRWQFFKLWLGEWLRKIGG